MNRFVRHKRMSLAAACLAMGQTAAADTASDVQATWQRYLDICSRAMADPQAYIDGLSSSYPTGNFGTSASADGQILRSTVVENGFFDMVEIWAVGTEYGVNCSTYRNTMDVNAEAIANAVQAVLASDPSVTFMGGQLAELYVEWNTEGPLRQNLENYYYYITGAFPGQDVITSIQTVSGYLSVAGTKQISP